MSINAEKRQIVHERSKAHCEYCKRPDEIMGSPFEIDHIQPISKGGTDDLDNLSYACRDCNLAKSNYENAIDPDTSNRVPLFNPRTQKWSEHFRFSDNYTVIMDLTPTGRATVLLLKMNNEMVVKARSGWRDLGWNPPME